MKVVTTNLLNRFWKSGIKPIKDALTGKVDSSRIVNSLLTTEAGFALDARQGKVLDDKVTELIGNFGGLKYKIYQVPARNWTKGSNTILTLDIDASKVREINALIYNSAVSYLLPISPFNENGEYMATFGANIRLNMQTGQLILGCGGTWNGYAMHVVVGYID